MARTGRPPKEDSGYHVSPHNANGYCYAATQPAVIDPDTGKKKYHYIHWGRLEDGNRFIPGKAYILASPVERGRLIFPDDWDISAIDELSGNRKPGRPAYNGIDVNRFYGDVWLLDQLAVKLGIRKDLMTVFNGNGEIVNDILTLAYFPIITEYSYRRLPRWQRIVKTPSERELTPSYVTRLTQNITEQHRKEFLELRASRLGEEEILAVDSTSRSAWGDSLADIHWGKNKDHLPLPQTKEVVAYTLTSHMPVYYRTFPGNMPDSRSLPIILTDMDHAGFKDVIFVTDRGYESLRNLETYIIKEMPFIACSEVGNGFVLEQIKSFGEFNTRPDDMEVDPILQVYYKQIDYTYNVKSKGECIKTGNLKINLYLDPVRRSSELVFLDSEIKLQEEEIATRIKEQIPCEDDATLKRKLRYFKVQYDQTTRLIKSYILDEKKVSKARMTSGFFAITTMGLSMDAIETYKHYRLRDEQEKYFQQMKSQLHFDKQQNSSEEGKTGRLFVLFISLILTSYIRHIWKTTELKKLFESSLDILDEMRPIRCIEHTNKAKIITPFVGDQVDICDAFEVDIPDGCRPDYRSRRKEGKRRGRPRKPLTEREV
jgi:hypothetical protein